MMNFLSLDVEEWFQVENLKIIIRRDDWGKYESRVVENTRRILEILREEDVKATYFVLGWVAEKFPFLVKEIDREGHEVASHGYNHELAYKLSKEEFREDILKAKDVLESITKKEVIGYRAPSFTITKDSLWALDILKECGYRYDSSIFPTSFHRRYGDLPAAEDVPFVFENGLREFHIANFSFLKIKFPLGGGCYFRSLPYPYFKYFFKKTNRAHKRFVFYIHPWEFDPNLPRLKLPLTYRFRNYVNLDKTEGRFRRLIRDFEFGTFKSAL